MSRLHAGSRLLFFSLIFTSLACDALAGKPDPNAPEGIYDPADRSRVCSETHSAISAWERERVEDIDDAF